MKWLTTRETDEIAAKWKQMIRENYPCEPGDQYMLQTVLPELKFNTCAGTTTRHTLAEFFYAFAEYLDHGD